MRKLLTLAILGTGIAGFAAAASAECSLGHKASLTTAQDATPASNSSATPRTCSLDSDSDDKIRKTERGTRISGLAGGRGFVARSAI